jgi:hypothetical protein
MKIHSRFITEVRSYSHILEKAAFAFLMREESLTRVRDVSQDRFQVEVIMTEEMKETNKDYFGYGFLVSSNFLMALNIAALGHFTWTAGNRLFWHCEHIGPSGKTEQILMQSQDISFPVEKMVLTEGEVRNSVIILGSLLRDPEQNFRREYLKGILHLNIGFGDLNFHREAFANFYRSFEYFMTSRVLKKKKLANEIKDLKEGMRLLGLPDEFCDEFTTLYKKRAEQVMHAQRAPEAIDAEDVLKIKVFTDYALNKYYRSKAQEWLEQRRRSNSHPAVE